MLLARLHHFHIFHIFHWFLLMVLSLCLQWIGLPFSKIVFYSNFTDGLHTYSLQIENLHEMEALQPVFQRACFKLWDFIARFYFIFIFREDGYRWSGWKELRKARNDKENISSVWNWNFMLRGLLLVLGTAFVRSLGAITHQQEKTRQPRARGEPRNGMDTRIQPGGPAVNKSQAGSLKSPG